MKSILTTSLFASAVIFSSILMSCNNSGSATSTTVGDSGKIKSAEIGNDSSSSIKPAGARPAWGPDIHSEMQAVIEKLVSFNAPSTEKLSAEAARKNPTPADAMVAVAKDRHILVPVPAVDTMGQEIPVQGGSLHARVYTPKPAGDSFPVIVYFHGGGWVIADINTYDASAAGLAEQVGAIIVSVEYRKGPEHKFPTAHNDAFAAYQWVLKNISSMKGIAKKIAVVGESAGGNLAANVSIMARDKKIQQPVYQVLIYPVASDNMNSASYIKYADAKPLNKPMMQWFAEKYLPSMASAADPRIALYKANLKGLPPTTIITAELDPLQDDGRGLSDALKKAGVDVHYKNYDGVTHEFFGMALVVPEARDAQALAATDLKKAFQK